VRDERSPSIEHEAFTSTFIDDDGDLQRTALLLFVLRKSAAVPSPWQQASLSVGNVQLAATGLLCGKQGDALRRVAS
jgi:hypothetical protein